MEYRILGHSGLKVSSIGLGTMTFGGKGVFSQIGASDVKEATRLVDIAIDHGVNFFDTANGYSDGQSEEILGSALKGRRDNLVLATKVHMKMEAGPNGGGLSRKHIIAQCEKSLKRLKTEYIDLYQVHEWDGHTPLEETLEALNSLIKSGKVRYIGCSNYAGWHLSKALSVSSALGYERFISQQIHYTLQAREAEYELLPIASDSGVGVLVWSPLAAGLLTGKYRRGQAKPEGRKLNGWDEPPVRDEDKLYNIIDELINIGEKYCVSAAQVSLAWLTQRPCISSLIVGARTEKQLLDNLGSAELKLSNEDIATLESISAPDIIYPYWHHLKSATERLSKIDLVPNEALKRQ